MKKLALAFSSKDRVELTKRSLFEAHRRGIDLFWNDGSVSSEGKQVHQTAVYDSRFPPADVITRSRVTGGPDRAIVYALSQILITGDVDSTGIYTPTYDYVGLLENDILLDPDWLEPTMALFDNPDGLPVGAVSARSYEDRILIQRDGYAICHNVGAGHIILTREAAQIILRNYRTGWWPENRAVFSQLSGLDIGKFGAFGFNEQLITADWSFDTILAAHGLATVALTPSKAQMIGQDIAEQGLKYATGESADVRTGSITHFERFRANLIDIRNGDLILPPVDHLLRTRGGSIIFPHHAAKHCGIFRGTWTTRWSQGFGPFMYVAGEGASFSIPIFGPCAFHVGGGAIKLTDDATRFSTEIDLSGQTEMVTLSVPRDMQTGIVRLGFSQGACLAGIETVHLQAVLKEPTFDYSQLPPVEEKQ